MEYRERKLAKNTIMLMVGKICTQCVNFFMLPLYTAVLTTAEYGTADLITTYCALLLPVVGLQFEQGLFRFLLEKRNSRQEIGKYISSIFFCNIVQILLLSAVVFVVSRFIDLGYIFFLIVLVPLQIIQAFLLQTARGVDRTDIYTIASFISATVQVVSNVILVGILKIGLVGLLYSMVIAPCVCILFLTYKLKVWRLISWRLYDRECVKSVAKYSLPLIPNQLSWWVINASDRTIVSYILGTSSNGIYSIANKFSSLYITFYNYFNMSWTESVALSINDSDKNNYINKMIRLFYRLLSCLTIGLIAIMPFIFPVLIKNAFHDAYYQIPILLIAVFFQALQGLYSAIYVALKKTGEIAKTSFISAVINIVVDLILIRYIGLYAASISTLVAFLSMAIYRYFDIRKYVDISLSLKDIILTSFICAFAICAYYSKNIMFEVICLLVVIAFSIYYNNYFIRSFLDAARRKTKGWKGKGCR